MRNNTCNWTIRKRLTSHNCFYKLTSLENASCRFCSYDFCRSSSTVCSSLLCWSWIILSRSESITLRTATTNLDGLAIWPGLFSWWSQHKCILYLVYSVTHAKFSPKTYQTSRVWLVLTGTAKSMTVISRRSRLLFSFFSKLCAILSFSFTSLLLTWMRFSLWSVNNFLESSWMSIKFTCSCEKYG